MLYRILSFGYEALRPGGHIALIIGATQDNGSFIDHTLILTAMTKVEMDVRQRVIVPYTSQQFSGANVALSRKSRMLLKGYRDLIIWKKPE